MSEFDSNIKVFADADFRKVDYSTTTIDPELQTDGFVNLYIDGKSADYVHDVLPEEENAINYIRQNEKLIYNILIKVLHEQHNCDPTDVGLYSISLTDQIEGKFAVVEFKFLDKQGEMFGIVMNKTKVIN